MKACIFDTETTGLVGNPLMGVSQQPYCIEFYGCLVDDEKGPEQLAAPILELEFLCKPPLRLEPIITKITGLTDADLANQKRFIEYVPQVREFFASGSAVVAHNLAFDYSMMSIEFERNGVPPLEWPVIKCCTVAQSEHLRGARLKLMDLHKHLFNEEFPQAHRARHDVKALARCWLELRKRGEV